MSEIGKIINSIIRLNLSALLKEQGFKRKGRTFHRLLEDRIDVVNIQGDKWNSGTSGQITMNLGVFFPAVAAVDGSVLFKGLPNEYNCTVRVRIGTLMPKGHDKWWKVSSSTIKEELSKELAKNVEQYGLPWLKLMSDLEQLKKNCRPLLSAAIALSQEKMDEVTMYLDTAIKEYPLDGKYPKMWAKKHGIEVL